MPRFTLSKLKQAKPSMRRRLFLYMGALAALLLVVLFVALLLLGRLKSPRAETERALTFQMEAFRADMTSLWRNVSVMGVHLSEDMTGIMEAQAAELSSLSGNADAMESLQEAMLESLCQYARQTDCSGAFVLLDASLHADERSYGGIYVQRGNAEHTTSDFLLYRGMADIGRRHQVMPHRKWAQEFSLSDFPDFSRHLKAADAPIERSCRTTEFITLPGTTEQAMLLTVPMIGTDGTVYGLCGFSVNQTYFSAHHAQPSGIGSLACILSNPTEGLNIQKCLMTYPAGDFCFVPDELLTEKALRGGLTAFVGSELSFVGLSEPFAAASGDTDAHALTVLIPKSSYDKAILKSGLEIAALLMLLAFFGVVCCLFYTRRYLRPILEDIEQVSAADGKERPPVFEELLPISEKIRAHEETVTVLKAERQDARDRAEQLLSEKQGLQEQVQRVEADAERLAQRRKGEIDPEEYRLFLAAYQKLDSDLRIVIDAMVDGGSVQELAERLGKKISTIYSYRRDVYGKVGIIGSGKLQQLRVFVTLMRREQDERMQAE